MVGRGLCLRMCVKCFHRIFNLFWQSQRSVSVSLQEFTMKVPIYHPTAIWLRENHLPLTKTREIRNIESRKKSILLGMRVTIIQKRNWRNQP